jgi:CheY-like chemotaxis protein
MAGWLKQTEPSGADFRDPPLETVNGDVILIVDDDESIRDALEGALELEDHRTASACNGREALMWLQRHPPPRLILLDLMMPVMDGWQVLEHLQADERLSSIPTIVITAFGRELGKAARLPMLRKPIELNDLLRMIDRHSKGTK